MKWDDVNHLHLEISALCNATCPQCARYPAASYLEHANINNTMRWSYDQVVQRLPREDLLNIKEILFNGTMGDFITNTDALKIVEHFARENLKIVINTNGSARTKEFWQALGKLPGHIEVNFALDGLADTHSLYRRDTNFDQIINNAKTLMEAGGKAAWTMNIFKHNQHQVEDCKQMAEQLGFVKFTARHSDRRPTPVYDRNENFLYMIENATDSPLTIKKSVTIEEIKNRRFQHLNKIGSKILVTEKHPLPNYETCDSLKKRSIYVGSDWHVAPCCFLGILSVTRTFDNRFENFLDGLSQIGRDLESCFATDSFTVKQAVDRGFGWIYDKITTPEILSGCYFHCHPKDSPFRISQANLTTAKINI